MKNALLNNETLRVHAHRVKDKDYLARTFERMGDEMSPFKDPSS
jgi:hypothetical protein